MFKRVFWGVCSSTPSPKRGLLMTGQEERYKFWICWVQLVQIHYNNFVGSPTPTWCLMWGLACLQHPAPPPQLISLLWEMGKVQITKLCSTISKIEAQFTLHHSRPPLWTQGANDMPLNRRNSRLENVNRDWSLFYPSRARHTFGPMFRIEKSPHYSRTGQWMSSVVGYDTARSHFISL